MFERFTDAARRVVVLAQQEARLLSHNYIGTEHVLLGLLSENDGLAAQTLQSLGVSTQHVRTRVEQIIGRGPSTPDGHVPFTPRAKTVMEYSLREALQLGHTYIGTEHILLGLIREGQGVAAQVLAERGVEMGRARQQIIKLLSGVSPTGQILAEDPPTCPNCKGSLSNHAQVKPLSLTTPRGQGVDLLAIYCGACGVHLAMVRSP